MDVVRNMRLCVWHAESSECVGKAISKYSKISSRKDYGTAKGSTDEASRTKEKRRLVGKNDGYKN